MNKSFHKVHLNNAMENTTVKQKGAKKDFNYTTYFSIKSHIIKLHFQMEARSEWNVNLKNSSLIHQNYLQSLSTENSKKKQQIF